MSLKFCLRGMVCAFVGLGVYTDATAVSTDDVPETVMVTYQVKANADAALAKVIAQHWSVGRRLNMIRATPHIQLKGGDPGKHFVVEVFTWRDGSLPDNAPDEITALWQEMGRLTEARDGRPGVDFTKVQMAGR